eukprot:TRINITY_DN4311_c0_g1_i9.p1 TRINITY_DN4311_c0_g1~~TRINITY_DN4311_c0_g1_i9.p1  ORF type:complete len:175 (+),score=25.04 TRINITY_DN4311_c0_g1_i9:74-598(+)
MANFPRQGSHQPRQPLNSDSPGYYRGGSPEARYPSGEYQRMVSTQQTKYDVAGREERQKLRERERWEKQAERDDRREREREREERRERRRERERKERVPSKPPTQPTKGSVKQPPILTKPRKEHDGVPWPPPGVHFYVDVDGELQVRPPHNPDEHTIHSRSYLRTVKIENLTND